MSTILRSLFFLLFWLPLHGLRWLRGRILRKKPVVKLVLGDKPMGGKATVKLLRRLERIARDADLRGVLIELRPVVPAYATVQQIRDVLAKMRSEGKVVMVQMNSICLRRLYLSSVADRVWLSPMGEAHLSGVGATIPFYGDALSRLGVEVQLISAGAYKSFGEPYSRAFPTAQNRSQLEVVLSDLQRQMVEAISTARELSTEKVVEALGSSPLGSDECVDWGLVDDVAYADQIIDQMNEILEIESGPLSIRPYGWMTGLCDWMARRSKRRVWIPVVHLRGPVVMSEDEGNRSVKIAADRVIPVLDAIAKDEECKAVVLAVSSPGGSALASDLIARSVERLGEGRAVVAWFGDVSASGGYYISALAQEIIANPATITGSIGVVGGKVVVGGAFAQVGIHRETVAAGPDVTMMGPWDAFTPDQEQRFRRSLVRVYDRFINVVARGRKMEPEAVHEVAEGRVWTGRQALERGLVDQLGGLDVAVARAAELGELEDLPHALEHIRFTSSPFKALQSFSRDSRATEQSMLQSIWSKTGGVLLSAVWRSPMEPLMVMPWEMGDSHDG